MKRQHLLVLVLFFCITLYGLVACKKRPFEPDYFMAIGYVIGREVCNADPNEDYWLINIISSASIQQQYGDTLLLNGVQYTNVVKSSGLPNDMKRVGTKIGMDFYLSKERNSSPNCTASLLVIFNLKVADVLYWSWAG